MPGEAGQGASQTVARNATPQVCSAGGRAPSQKNSEPEAMDAAPRRAARLEAGRPRKKKPAGAMDGPAGVKWRGQDSNL